MRQQRCSPAAEGSLVVSSSCQLTMLQANKLTTMRVGRSLLLGAEAMLPSCIA